MHIAAKVVGVMHAAFHTSTPPTDGKPAAKTTCATVLFNVECSTCTETTKHVLKTVLCHAAAGVWRSHSCCLQLPLQQPANVAAAALQLPGGRVAISITLSLEPNSSSSLLLLEAALRPQYGLMLSSSSSGGLGLGSGGPCLGEVLPMRVLPGGSAGLCFMLMQDQGGHMICGFTCGLMTLESCRVICCVGLFSLPQHRDLRCHDVAA
jgi:hypothetical protein